MSPYTVAIDSDGVLADFDKLVTSLLGGPIDPNKKGSVWAAVRKYDTEVAPFFESLEEMPGARLLVDFCVNNFRHAFVLTATGGTPANAAQQKINWYKKRWPKLHVECVMKSPDKAAFAGPDVILIDDRAKSIDPWVAAGGIGILHTSLITTIEELNKYINQKK